MRKLLLIPVFFSLAAGTLCAQQLLLKDVITRSARDVENALNAGNVIAVVNFTSPSEVFSEYVIQELIGELVSGKKVVVVERNNLDLIRQEMDIQLSGDVSDASMVSIGHQLGAQYLVSGSLTNMGKYYRFRIKVIGVETAKIQTQNSLSLKNDSQVAFLVTERPEGGPNPPDSLFYEKQKWAIGVGMEANMNSTRDAAGAFEMKFSSDYTINSLFAFGVDLGMSFSEIYTFESTGYFRWYFLKNIQAFAQVNSGLWAATEVGPRFLIGATGGARLPLSRNMYIEPYARIGYPFMLGAGITAGLRLPMISANEPIGGEKARGAPAKQAVAKDTPVAKEVTFEEQVAAIVNEYKDDAIWLEFDSDGRLRLMVSVVFSANNTEFDGLSPEIMASNDKTLRYVADILKRTKYSDIIIEGYANPTQPEGRARDREENELKLLSRLRALTVVDELRKYGVNLNRRNVQGLGATRLVAPYNDAKNNWKNRRVEFILIK